MNELELKNDLLKHDIYRLNGLLTKKTKDFRESELSLNWHKEEVKRLNKTIEQYSILKQELVATIDNLNVDIQTLKRQNQILIDRSLQK